MVGDGRLDLLGALSFHALKLISVLNLDESMGLACVVCAMASVHAVPQGCGNSPSQASLKETPLNK